MQFVTARYMIVCGGLQSDKLAQKVKYSGLKK